MVSPSLRQLEHPLGDDVQLDLRGASLDRVAAGPKPVAGYGQVVGLVGTALPAERSLSEQCDEELLASLIQLGAIHLEKRGLGARPRSTCRAVAASLHGELEARLIHEELGEPIAQDRIDHPSSRVPDCVLRYLDDPIRQPRALAGAEDAGD